MRPHSACGPGAGRAAATDAIICGRFLVPGSGEAERAVMLVALRAGLDRQTVDGGQTHRAELLLDLVDLLT